MSFKVEKSNLKTLEGVSFLKGEGIDKGHCHLHKSVKKLLSSETFIENNPNKVDVFRKADRMMNEGKTGDV